MVACANCGTKMELDGEKEKLLVTIVQLYCPNCGHQDEIAATAAH